MTHRPFLSAAVCLWAIGLAAGSLFQPPRLTAEEPPAIAKLISQIEANPGDARLQYNLGVQYLQANRFEEAIATNRQAVELEPGLALAWYNLGFALQSLERWEEAREAYQRCTEADPAYAPGFMNLGGARQKLGQCREAAEAYRACAQLRPNDVEAQFGLAWMLLAGDDIAAAREQYPILAALDQTRADNLYNQYQGKGK